MYKLIKIFISFMIFHDTILSYKWLPGRFNAAFNKTTYQSSDFDTRGISGNAVDGNKHSIAYHHKSCAHTKETDHTWWAVDLGLAYYIYSVTLTNRGEKSGNFYVYKRLQNFTISGSSTSYIPGLYDSVRCAFQSEPMGNGETKTFPCVGEFSARFVIITKTTPMQALTLCEVEVEARCRDEFNGENCFEFCSGNCELARSCNIIDGHCVQGCKPGYTSDKCDQVCPDGKFGDRCYGKCSDKCLNPTCDKFDDTGVCLSGCIAGYYGDHCNTTCPVGTYGKVCSKGNGIMISWTVVCVCITVCVISGVIGLVFCQAMRNKPQATRTNDLSMQHNVSDSGISVHTSFGPPPPSRSSLYLLPPALLPRLPLNNLNKIVI